MTESREQRIRRKLEDELARVNESIVAIKKEPRAEELEGFGDNTPLSEEADASSVTEQRELQSDRLGRLLDRAAALDEAIHRVNQGVYGTCVSCGAKISEERLKAVPEAARCAKCQSDAERSQPRAEPTPTEWTSAAEVYEKREAFDEKGFEHHPERARAASRFSGDSESED